MEGIAVEVDGGWRLAVVSVARRGSDWLPREGVVRTCGINTAGSVGGRVVVRWVGKMFGERGKETANERRQY